MSEIDAEIAALLRARERREDVAAGFLVAKKTPAERAQMGCLSKDKFALFSTARAVATAMARRGRSGAITPYRCGVCGAWHLGRSSVKA